MQREGPSHDLLIRNAPESDPCTPCVCQLDLRRCHAPGRRADLAAPDLPQLLQPSFVDALPDQPGQPDRAIQRPNAPERLIGEGRDVDAVQVKIPSYRLQRLPLKARALEFNRERQVPACEGLREVLKPHDPLPLKGRVKPPAKVQLAQLRVSMFANCAAAVGLAVDLRVVKEDDCPIPGLLQVQFDAVGAHPHAQLKRRHGVLGRIGRRPSVRVIDKHVHSSFPGFAPHGRTLIVAAGPGARRRQKLGCTLATGVDADMFNMDRLTPGRSAGLKGTNTVRMTPK